VQRVDPFQHREPVLPEVSGARQGLLVERPAAQRQALALLKRSGFLTLSAPPRSGVTTFLFCLRRELSKWAYLDLANHAFADDPPREAARALAKEIARVEPGLKIPADPASVGDVLSALASKPSPEPLVVLVDGFDAWSDESARKLVLALRAAYTEARTRAGGRETFALVTGSSADLRDLTASGRTSPLNLAQHLFLPDFEASEVETLFFAGFKEYIEPAAVLSWAKLAYHWAAGHPALTQMLGSLFHERIPAGLTPERAAKELLPAAKEAAADLLASTLGVLSERPVLREMAARVYTGEVVPFDRIHRPVRELLHLGLIRSGDRGLCRPRNFLYEQVCGAALNTGATDELLWSREASTTTVRRDGPPEEADLGVHQSTTDPTPLEDALTRATPPPGSSRRLPEPPQIEVGTLIGGCRVVRRIGRGAMSEVYLAKHLALDLDVAVKVLRHAASNDRRIAQRFLREARAAAQLSHEHIVQIRNVGRDGPYQFIEMEYLAGGSLAELLKDGPYKEVRFCAEWLRQAAQGLQVAHGRGIVHRDLKPDNLMLTRERRLKVVDFGLAAVGSLEGGSRLTQEGTILGTPHYMAPEQWEGRAIDERSDMYSLGAAFYHVLTGRTPFEGGTAMELIANVSRETPPTPGKLNPAVPERFSRILLKLLAREPEERIASAADLVKETKGLPAEC